MSFAENTQRRELEARVESLEAQVKDLTRRLDDLSNAERKRQDTLGLKKASNG